MSLNTFMKHLDPCPIKGNTNEEETITHTRMEKLDTFLDTRVINKYKQSWKNLTKFLKRDRILFFFDTNVELKEHLSMVLEHLNNNTITPKDIKYNETTGEIDNIYKLKT